jgi:transglutaminase-like putative cysteine protease
VAGAVIAVEWLRFEAPLAAPARAGLLVALAAAVAALPSRRIRAAGIVVAAVIALRLAFGVWLPLHPVSGISAVWTQFDSGFADFYSTHLPFDPRFHADMTELVLLAVFVFTLGVGLAAAARRPVAAAVILLVGAGWPATLIVPTRGVATTGGAAILGAALVVLAVAGSRRISGYVVPVALALVLGGVLIGTAAASNRPTFHWQNWNLAGGGGVDNVRFVWDARYEGLHWPKVTTTMLEVRSTSEPGYLRAAVLDDFVGGRWVAGPPRPADALEPSAAFRRANQTKEAVTVDGLVDTHLLGGSVPVRFTSDPLPFESAPGLAQLATEFGRGFQYTAWSYAPSPSAHALSRSPARYPAELLDGGMLGIGNNISLPVFGAPGREAEVARALSLRSDLLPYERLARLAERVTSGAKTPYAAVVDLERWFLVGGGFTYSNHPHNVAPVLVGFATTTRTGYCQHFAGAMALMLRYLGIPARVAVGFAGPVYDRAAGRWMFTDHDAHAWVEVWFKRYGWLTFDPTPAAPGSSRGRLIAAYTHAGSSGPGARGGGHPVPHVPESAGNGVGQGHRGPEGSGVHVRRRGGSGAYPYALVFLFVLVGVVGGIVLAKEARRRVRGLARDPRRVAAACRDELANFLLDQEIDPPPSATVRELGLLVQRRFGADADGFVAATTAARFAHPEAAAAAARAARRESRLLLASCRRFLTRRERLRGLLSLRSLVRIRRTVDESASLGST